jgi:hypothetical protein
MIQRGVSHKEEQGSKEKDEKSPKDKEDTPKEIKNIHEQKFKLLETEELFTEKDLDELDLDDASLLMDGILSKSDHILRQQEPKEKQEAKEISKQDLMESLIYKKQLQEDEKSSSQKLENLHKYEDKKLRQSPFYSKELDDIKLDGKYYHII